MSYHPRLPSAALALHLGVTGLALAAGYAFLAPRNLAGPSVGSLSRCIGLGLDVWSPQTRSSLPYGRAALQQGLTLLYAAALGACSSGFLLCPPPVLLGCAAGTGLVLCTALRSPLRATQAARYQNGPPGAGLRLPLLGLGLSQLLLGLIPPFYFLGNLPLALLSALCLVAQVHLRALDARLALQTQSNPQALPRGCQHAQRLLLEGVTLSAQVAAGLLRLG